MKVEIIIDNVLPISGDQHHDEIIAHWEDVRNYFINSNELIDVNIDSIIDLLESTKEENLDVFFEKKMEHVKSLDDYLKNRFTLAKIVINTKSDDFHTERFLQQLFLAMNISFCGSCNFSGYIFKKGSWKDSLERKEYLRSDIFVSSDELDKRLNENILLKIEFSQAWEWLEENNIRKTILAKTPIQKACVTLLKLSSDKIHYEEQILIVTQVLEALLLKKGEPKAYSLVKKIDALLGFKDHNNLMKSLYTMRSNITHGETAVLWSTFTPDPYDYEESEKHIRKLQGLFEYGVLIIVSIVQDLILNNSKGYDFTASISFTRK